MWPFKKKSFCFETIDIATLKTGFVVCEKCGGLFDRHYCAIDAIIKNTTSEIKIIYTCTKCQKEAGVNK
jgi:Fe2+ or Zn2+ uptake regulation protein